MATLMEWKTHITFERSSCSFSVLGNCHRARSRLSVDRYSDFSTEAENLKFLNGKDFSFKMLAPFFKKLIYTC